MRRALPTLALLTLALGLTACGSDGAAADGAESIRPTYMDSQRSTLSDQRAETRELMDTSGVGTGAAPTSTWYNPLSWF